MGYNTTVLILNDALDQILKHPEQFAEGIYYAALGDGGTVSVGNHANQVEVMPTAHADTPRLYHSHGNMMLDLSPWSKETMRLAVSEHQFQRDVVDSAIADAERMLKRLKKAIKAERKEVDGDG